MPKYQNTVYYDIKSWVLVIFSSNYRHRLVLKIPFPDHIFLKTSKYRTENLRFLSIGKHYPPSSPPLLLTGILSEVPEISHILGKRFFTA